MQIANIILSLRNSNTIFGDYVFGSAKLDEALKNTLSLSSDCAFVVPTGDSASGSKIDNGLIQTVTEKFSIVTANKSDVIKNENTGINAYNLQHTVRKQLFKSLIGRYVDEDADRDQTGIEYVGSNIVGINGAYLWWQYDFTYSITLQHYGEDGLDGYNPDIENTLPYFNKIHADIIMTPSFKFETLNEELPLSSMTTDSAQDIDLTQDPRGGSFWFGFGDAFNKLRR